MKCKHSIEIYGRLKARCRDCSIVDFSECRQIRKCSHEYAGIHCLFCNVEDLTACESKWDQFETSLINMAFGC